MKFTQAEPNENFEIARWLSEGGRWEFGFRQMLFGVRVSVAGVDAYGCCLDYCAADEEGFALALLATVAKILERYPENVTERQLKQDFPQYNIKPINKDPQCWAQLQAIAGFISLDEHPSIKCPQCHKRSYNPNDIQQKYCVYCHQFHEFMLT